MFTEVQIENYKSIQSLKINLGRVNVFIGENGCGKSNILEAIALAGAAAADKLDNEFLAPRGIRVTDPEFMRSAFEGENILKGIKLQLRMKKRLHIGDSEVVSNFLLQNDNQPYSSWKNIYGLEEFLQSGESGDSQDEIESKIDSLSNQKFVDIVVKHLLEQIEERQQNLVEKNNIPEILKEKIYKVANNSLNEFIALKHNNSEIKNFLIYSPENSLLRTFVEEGQIQPLGSKGEGLLKLLRVLSNTLERIDEIKQKLELIDWFDDFKIHQDSDIERTIQIKDRYLDKELPYFNQRSSNEGFLFLIFYFALFVSDDTPKFFAIDNIENGLNPKLCTKLIEELVELAKKYDKQVIFTTHNPAVLDGLDLEDDDQKLFTIYRNIDGHTKAKRVYPRKPVDDDDPVPLSEAFMNGYIGGLPNNF
jgi:predicted ATPase